MYLRYLLLLPVLLTFFIASAQTKATADNFPFVYATYSIQVPGGDMADKYGYSSDIGGGVGLKIKSNWIFSLDGVYLFGNEVKEDPLMSISNDNGGITNRFGAPSQIYMRLSGFHFRGTFGKIIPLLGSNKNSGILIRGSIGMLQHRIFYSVTGNNVEQIKGAYTYGYDRMCNGVAVSEFIGWQQFSDKKFYNFFAGVEFTQAFTQNQRQWDFATEQKIDAKRLDLLYAFRIGLMIRFKSRQATEYYYF